MMMDKFLGIVTREWYALPFWYKRTEPYIPVILRQLLILKLGDTA
jgi:hypothetical protein